MAKRRHERDSSIPMPQYLQDYLSDFEMRVRHEKDVNARLRAYGAKTFGPLKRREERLRRFDEEEAKRQAGRRRLEEARKEAEERITARAVARVEELKAEIRESIETSDCLGRLMKSIQNGFVRITRG